MGDDAIRVNVADFRGLVVVTVDGEISVVTAPTLDAALNELKWVRRIVLDLSGTTFMDASGVALLLEHEQRVNASGGALLVRCPVQPATQPSAWAEPSKTPANT